MASKSVDGSMSILSPRLRCVRLDPLEWCSEVSVLLDEAVVKTHTATNGQHGLWEKRLQPEWVKL
jgi:hypothetical protein